MLVALEFCRVPDYKNHTGERQNACHYLINGTNWLFGLDFNMVPKVREKRLRRGMERLYGPKTPSNHLQITYKCKVIMWSLA